MNAVSPAAMVPVFDLGNVLVLHYLERCFAALAEACPEGTPVEELFYAAFDREDVGRGGDFERIYPELVREAGLRLSRDAFRWAWNDVFEANPPMVEYVRGLTRPRVLLSNTNAPHAAWIATRFPEVFPLFDHCVLSHEVRLAKPDPAIFRHVESVTGAPAGCHVFVDDMEENVAAARACGWQAIRFVGVEDCRQRLAGLGIGDGGVTDSGGDCQAGECAPCPSPPGPSPSGGEGSGWEGGVG